MSTGHVVGPDKPPEPPRKNDADVLVLLEEALTGPHIAGDRHTVVVCVPHQNKLDIPLRVEVWGESPPRDLGQWEEIFECALEVDGGELWYGSPTLESVRCAVPDGRYGVHICGGGFVNRGLARHHDTRRRLAGAAVAVDEEPAGPQDPGLAASGSVECHLAGHPRMTAGR